MNFLLAKKTTKADMFRLFSLMLFPVLQILPAQAGDFAYELGYAVMRSDNIRRAPVVKEDETVHGLVGSVAYQENTASFLANVLATAEYNDYKDNTFSDEGVYGLNASLLWAISPQRFTWTVQDVLQERVVDATLTDTPNNRTDVNVFETGPDFYFRFNPLHTLAVGARAGNVDAGRANLDSDRAGGSLRWLYQATPITTHSLNFVGQDVNYDDSAANTDFTRQDAFVRTEYRPARSRLGLDVGGSRINKARGRDLEETLARFFLGRELSEVSSLGLSLSRELADTGTDIAAAPLPSATPFQPAARPVDFSADVVSDVYTATRGNLNYSQRGSLTEISLSADAQELDYETQTQDRRDKGGSFSLDYFSTSATTITLFGGQTRTDFRNVVRRDTKRNYGIRLRHNLSRSISVGVEGRQLDRTSTDSTREYEENRVLFFVLYSAGTITEPLSGRFGRFGSYGR